MIAQNEALEIVEICITGRVLQALAVGRGLNRLQCRLAPAELTPFIWSP